MTSLAAPPAVSAASFLGNWSFAVVPSVACLLLAAAYLAASRLSRRRAARRWPATRSLAFLAGLALVVIATDAGIATFDDALFSAHMLQHVLLIMVAPPLLVYGRPVTLLMHTLRGEAHRTVKRVVRSRTVEALTRPWFVVTLYTVVVVGTHLPPVMDFVVRNPAVHDLEHLLYLVCGYLFFLPVVGSEPLRRGASPATRLALLVAAMPVDTAVGVALMLVAGNPFSAYRRAAAPFGITRLADVHLGGAIMWIASDVVMVAISYLVVLGFLRDPRRTGYLGGGLERLRARSFLRQVGPFGLLPPPTRTIDDDAHLAAYNAYLAEHDPRRARS